MGREIFAMKKHDGSKISHAGLSAILGYCMYILRHRTYSIPRRNRVWSMT